MEDSFTKFMKETVFQVVNINEYKPQKQYENKMKQQNVTSKMNGVTLKSIRKDSRTMNGSSKRELQAIGIKTLQNVQLTSGKNPN